MKEGNQFNWGIISKYRSQVMGIAILWIILFHAKAQGIKIPHMQFLNYILNHGNLGVEIFLFVSGIGMYFSLSKGYKLWDFYKKRLSRVLIPYLYISLLLWVWQDLFVAKDIAKFFYDYSLLSFWFDGVRRLWFIALILVLYFITPFVYEFIKNENKFRNIYMILFGILFIIAYFVFGHFAPNRLNNIEIAVTRIPIYFIGMYLGPKVKENKPITGFELLIGATIIFGVICAVGIDCDYHRLLGSLITIPLVFTFALLSDFMSRGIVINKFLIWCGGVSLELYMIHVILRRYLKTYGDQKSALSYALLMLVTFGLAYFIQFIRKKVRERKC